VIGVKNMKHATMLAAALAAFAAAAPAAWAQDPGADEILARVDANQAFRTIEYTARMEIRLGKELRVKTMRAWAQGAEKAFVEFTNPEDAGTRMLKLGKDLWMYFPREQDTVRISGHLLKDGMMGSDLSYEDALESDGLSAAYSATLTGRDTLDGRPVFVVELRAKAPTAKYDRRVMRIDAERYVVLAEEMYARSGRLLKESRTVEVKRIGTRWYPVAVTVSDRLRKDSSTTVIMESITLDPVLDPALFTRAALER